MKLNKQQPIRTTFESFADAIKDIVNFPKLSGTFELLSTIIFSILDKIVRWIRNKASQIAVIQLCLNLICPLALQRTPPIPHPRWIWRSHSGKEPKCKIGLEMTLKYFSPIVKYVGKQFWVTKMGAIDPTLDSWNSQL